MLHVSLKRNKPCILKKRTKPTQNQDPQGEYQVSDSKKHHRPLSF